MIFFLFFFSFFFNDTATTEIYTLSLHDALPISQRIADSAYTTLYLYWWCAVAIVVLWLACVIMFFLATIASTMFHCSPAVVFYSIVGVTFGCLWLTALVGLDRIDPRIKARWLGALGVQLVTAGMIFTALMIFTIEFCNVATISVDRDIISQTTDTRIF